MEIQSILQQVITPLLLTFLFTSILSLSLGITLKSLISALRQKRIVTVSLFTNVIVVPAATVALTTVIPLDASFVMGLILYSLMGGTEGGPKFVQLAGGDVSLALGLLVILLMLTICIVPLALPLFVEVDSLNLEPIIIKLSTVVVLPMALGLFINAKRAGYAKHLFHICHRISVITLIATVFTLVYINFQTFTELRFNELVACVLFFVIAFFLGYVSGGHSVKNRRSLSIMTFGRNGSVSMLVAMTVFGADSKELVTVTIMSVMSVVVASAVCAVFNFNRNSADKILT